MFKQTFTQPGTNTPLGFAGTSTSTPFGQSSFGNVTNTSGFGSTAFGAASTPMYGGQNQTQTGLFASTTSGQAFGQPAQPQSAFAFGSPNTKPNLFNQSQQPLSSGLFGVTTNSTFGQKAPFSTFGPPPSSEIFGSIQSTPPHAQAIPLFGQPAPQHTGLFGDTSPFSSNQHTGTVIKFNPITGTDTMIKNRHTHQIQTRHHCITFMKEYETKSLEELRYEDYLVNRKGPQQNTGGAGLFGQMSTTNIGGAGLFGATPSVSSFGQKFSVFGAQQNTNLFGKKPTVDSPFSLNPQPTATVTLFGNTPAKPLEVPAPNTGLFSTPSTQPTNTFGATNTFGNFVSSTGTFTLNPSISTGLNTFGQQQTTLFGGNKEAPNVFGAASGGLEQPAQSQSTFGGFGVTQPQKNSLFNNFTFNKPATCSFGTVQPQSNVFMGVNLNQPQQQTQTNLFGQKPTNSISGQPTAPQQTMPFTGFGQQGVQGGLLSFGGSLIGQNQQQQSSSFPTEIGYSNVHDQILTIITKPYHTIDCLKKISPQSKNGTTNTTNPFNIKSMTDYKLSYSSKQFQVPLKIRTLGSHSDKKTLFGGLELTDSLAVENLCTTRNPRRLYIKKQLIELYHADNDLTESSIENETESNTEISSITWMNDLECIGSQILATNDSDRAEIEIRQRHLAPAIQQTSPKFGSHEQSMLLELSRGDLNTSSASIDSDPNRCNLTGIVCTRFGYYTIPSLDELSNMMTPDGRCIVQGFTIGRLRYGNVFFPDTFDVAGINIDEHVHFRNKELEIYVNDENKPPLGHELNRHAQITLDQVYPRDKETMLPISDVDRLAQMNYEDFLRTFCDRHGTTFVDYRLETGSWVFKVQHFTRYGLSDEEGMIILKKAANALQQKRTVVEKPTKFFQNNRQ